MAAPAQKEHRQICPRPGWVAHDPVETWQNSRDVMRAALAKEGVSGSDLAAVGITNHRETTVVWGRRTGRPFTNAMAGQCKRTQEICNGLAGEGGKDCFRQRTGLPLLSRPSTV